MQKLITSISKFHGPLLVIVDAFIIAVKRKINYGREEGRQPC